MKTKEIVRELKRLSKIRPEKEWVVLTKKTILGESTSPFLLLRPLYAGLFLFFILIGLFSVSQNSLPGEPLYSLKKVGEKIEIALLPETEKPKLNLEIANKRVEELKEAAKKNDVKKLAPAVKEAKETIAGVKESLIKSTQLNKEILKKTLVLAAKTKEVEESLGINPVEEDLKEIVKYIIEDFENKSLTKEQKDYLEKAKEYFENGNLERSLETLLLLPQN